MTDHRSTAFARIVTARPCASSRSRRLGPASALAASAFALIALCAPTQAIAVAPTSTPADIADFGAEPEVTALAVQWPLETRGAHITDGFGDRIAPCSNCSSDHRGLDFAAPAGTPVGAIADGVVVEAVYTDSGGLGLHVVIEHEIDGQLIESVSAHLDFASITVEVGDRVRVGDRIGSVGNTGASTGPHLHLETIVDGVHRDPLAVLLKYADHDDEIDITDRPSLPWLPTGPGAGTPADTDESADTDVPADIGASPGQALADDHEPETAGENDADVSIDVTIAIAIDDEAAPASGVSLGAAHSTEPSTAMGLGSGS